MKYSLHAEKLLQLSAKTSWRSAALTISDQSRKVSQDGNQQTLDAKRWCRLSDMSYLQNLNRGLLRRALTKPATKGKQGLWGYLRPIDPSSIDSAVAVPCWSLLASSYADTVPFSALVETYAQWPDVIKKTKAHIWEFTVMLACHICTAKLTCIQTVKRPNCITFSWAQVASLKPAHLCKCFRIKVSLQS